MHTRFLRLTLAACACAIALAAAPLRAQVVEQRIQIASDGGAGGIQMPMGMGGRQNKTGTGRIRGRVVASDGSGPVRRAQVRLTSQDITPKVALTDAEGRFEFRELPASRFTMQASKSGFVTIQYGQNRPFESGKPIELAERQLLDNADIAVPRGGVISGRIVDEFGDALPDVQVTAMRQTWSNGRRRLTPSPGRVASTNDLGQFRIYGLPPGEYYVSASMRGSAIEMMDMEVMMVAATGATAAAPTASAPKSGYASTYYPGTANVAEAQRVTLASGQEATGADFPLVPVRLARVTGVVINSEGKPVEGAMVSVVPSSRDVGFALGLSTARSARNGTFALNNVPPGDYVLQTRAMQVFSSTQGDNVMMFRAAAMAGESESGSAPLSVAGEDIENLMLTTSKGGTAVGRVSFDGPKPANAPVRVMATPTDPENPIVAGGAAATVNEDGTFELKGLAGTRLIRAASAARLDGEVGEAQRSRHHRLGRRLQNGRDDVRARDRIDFEGDGGVGRRDRERRAAQGLHGGGVFRDAGSLAPADDAVGGGRAAGPGRALQDPEPAGWQLLRRRCRLPAAGGMGRPGDPRSAQDQGDALHARRRRDADARSQADRELLTEGLRPSVEV